jgi:hypothetical protein
VSAYRLFIIAIYLLTHICFTHVARAEEIIQKVETVQETKKDDESKTRNFYEVLNDVLADFEYDLKNGQVSGIKDMSIRNIATSENIPPSFKQHIELLVTEKIIKTTKARVIQCLPCKAKKTTLDGEKVIVTSPETNNSELYRIAKTSGISNFMDIAYAYQPSGMVLSMHTVDAETGSIIWSRSYNSETSRASAFRRGEDFTQIDAARKNEEYVPETRFILGVAYFNEPNIGTRTSALGIVARIVERYDNRKKEVGFELNYILDTSALIGGSTVANNVWAGFNLTLLFVHTWNLIGEIENFNRPRGALVTSIGGTYAGGFLGALIRVAYEWRLAKHWSIDGILGYRPASSQFSGTTNNGTLTGLEFGVGVGYAF